MIQNEIDLEALVTRLHGTSNIPKDQCRTLAAKLHGLSSFEEIQAKIARKSLAFSIDAMEKARLAFKAELPDFQSFKLGDTELDRNNEDIFEAIFLGPELIPSSNLRQFDSLSMRNMITTVAMNTRHHHWGYGQTELLSQIDKAPDVQSGQLNIRNMPASIKYGSVAMFIHPETGDHYLDIQGFCIEIYNGKRPVAQATGYIYTPIEEPDWSWVLGAAESYNKKCLKALMSLEDVGVSDCLDCSVIHFESVFVATDFRARGIATQLVTDSMRFFVENFYAGYVYIRGFCEEVTLRLPEGSKYGRRLKEIGDYFSKQVGTEILKTAKELQVSLFKLCPDAFSVDIVKPGDPESDHDHKAKDAFDLTAEKLFEKEEDRERMTELARNSFTPGAPVDQMISWDEVESFDDAIVFCTRLGISRSALTPQSCGPGIGILSTLRALRPELHRADAHIVIAGASVADIGAACFVQMVSAIHPEFPVMRLSLVGDDLPDEDPMLSSEDIVSVHCGLLAHLPLMIDDSDVSGVLLTHPGIYSSRDLWLRDQGLFHYVKKGVPMMLTAICHDHAMKDRELLAAYGYKVGPLRHNPIAAPIASEGLDEPARICHFVYEIVGVDEHKWSNPDLAAAQAALNVPIHEAIKREFKVAIDNRRMILADTDEDARAELHDAFKVLVRNSPHSAAYFRDLFEDIDSRSLLRSYQLARYATVGIAKVEGMSDQHLIDFFTANPEAVNAVDGYGDDPLVVATMFERGDLVRWLLEHGANPLRISDEGRCALEIALEDQDESLIQTMLAYGEPEEIERVILRALEFAVHPSFEDTYRKALRWLEEAKGSSALQH